ncbi:MAG TPA: OadG family protein [Levilinea sp.]|nr:OadG family protein [Levilinea sp.]
MQSPLVTSLIITVIGMGLVFSAIMLLWGLMEVLVKVTADKTLAAPTAQPEAMPALVDDNSENKARAAATAVAIALAMRQVAPQRPENAAGISPWQAVGRAGQLSQRSTSFNRKPRGTVR